MIEVHHICEVTWLSKGSEGAQKSSVDAAPEKARWGWWVVGMDRTEELGLESEGWVETEKKGQNKNWGGKNFTQGAEGHAPQVPPCLTEQDVGGGADENRPWGMLGSESAEWMWRRWNRTEPTPQNPFPGPVFSAVSSMSFNPLRDLWSLCSSVLFCFLKRARL